ncbi:MAG: hypothetical protein ABF743_11160 [Schleiferilactobacillus perolens]|uniref:hypothetical protein n=1 Tax=Schleiferilactobacillus perolens TaxID=100468 RepID=UPI0039E84F3D
MTTKPKRWRIVLVMALCIIVGMIAYRAYQDEKAREAKRIDMIGAVDPETLVASKKPVTKIQVGVTYIAYSKAEWGNYAWKYIKLVSDTKILSVNDEAHHPKSYYYQRDSDGEAYLKALVVNECMYEIKDGNYYSTSGIATQLFFKVKEHVGKGSRGDYSYKQREWGGAGALEFKNGRYRTNTFRLDGYPGDLYKAKVQLPNSLDEYVSQYKMASPPPVISGEDGS